MTIKEAYRSLISRLRPKFGTGESESLARLIFSHMGYDRTVILAGDDRELADTDSRWLESVAAELYQDRPIQYILGYTWFFDLKIRVNEAVLIPRPETEELADRIIRDQAGSSPVILDIGTGSGCLAIVLSRAFPGSRVYATDISPEALETARDNARRNQAGIHFYQDDILHQAPPQSLPPFTLIVSNPPYVRNSEKNQMERNVLAWEPHGALFVEDEDPLVYFSAIRDFCLGHLAENGRLYLEINENLGPETAALFDGPEFKDTMIIKDIRQKDRFIKTIKT